MLRAVPVRTGAAIDLLPELEAVLAGQASAVVPVPADDPRETRLLSDALRVGEPIDDDVAVVVSTSGTTGKPKGAMLTASALAASAAATHARLGGPGSWLLALPAHHVAGLQVLVRSAVAGTTPVALAPGFGPGELPAAIARLDPGRRYASLVAIQLDKVLDDPAATAALASLDGVLVGGGPLPGPIAARAAAAGVRVIRTYGMSETSGGCVYDGRPLDGVAIRIDAGRVVLACGGVDRPGAAWCSADRRWRRATATPWYPTPSRSPGGFAPMTLACLMIRAHCESWAGSTTRSAPAA